MESTENGAWITISSTCTAESFIALMKLQATTTFYPFRNSSLSTRPIAIMVHLHLCSSHAYAAPGKHAYLNGVTGSSCSSLKIMLPWGHRVESGECGMVAHYHTRHGKCSSERRAPSVVHCQPGAQSTEPEKRPSTETQSSSISGRPALLAIGSLGLATVAFLASRSLLGRPALDELRLQSLPLDTALENGRPTLLEFYADWCEVCNELAPATLQVRPTVTTRVSLHLYYPCISTTKASAIKERSFSSLMSHVRWLS